MSSLFIDTHNSDIPSYSKISFPLISIYIAHQTYKGIWDIIKDFELLNRYLYNYIESELLWEYFVIPTAPSEVTINY